MAEDLHLPSLISDEINVSRSEARRLLATGGVKLNGKPLFDLDVDPRHLEGKTITVGKRRSFVMGGGE